MQGLVDGTIALDDTVVEHFDRCLGCMVCVTACPSGVQYDRLIEQTRDHVERPHRRSPLDTLRRAADLRRLPPPAAATRGARAAGGCPPPGPCAARSGAPVGRGGCGRRSTSRMMADVGPRRPPLRAERRLRRRERGDSARPPRRGLRRHVPRRQAAAARYTRHAGRLERASRGPGGSPRTSPATTTSSRTRPAAART